MPAIVGPMHLIYDLRKTRRELIPFCVRKPWQGRFRIGLHWWRRPNVIRFPE